MAGSRWISKPSFNNNLENNDFQNKNNTNKIEKNLFRKKLDSSKKTLEKNKISLRPIQKRTEENIRRTTKAFLEQELWKGVNIDKVLNSKSWDAFLRREKRAKEKMNRLRSELPKKQVLAKYLKTIPNWYINSFGAKNIQTQEALKWLENKIWKPLFKANTEYIQGTTWNFHISSWTIN